MEENVNKELVYQLAGQIKVMKPNQIDTENLKQLSRLNTLYDNPNFVAEEKIDGCHYFSCAHFFFSTSHVEKTDNFPHLRDFLKGLNMPNLILDGEIYYPGKTSQFCTRVTGPLPHNAQAFQNKHGLIHFKIFDILRTGRGLWVVNLPYFKRRELLEYFYSTFVKGSFAEEFISLADVTEENKEQYKEDILAQGGEGIVLKDVRSPYMMGKKPMWIWMKVKQADEADLIITGTQEATMEYTGKDYDSWPYWKEQNGIMVPVSKFYHNNWIGAIELSAYVNGKLTLICTCSGFDEGTRKDISENPSKYLGKVAKIGFMEKTEAGFPRHPKFDSLHPDKNPDECTWTLTNET